MSTRRASLRPLSSGKRTITDSGSRARRPVDRGGSAVSSKTGSLLLPFSRLLNERGAITRALNENSKSKVTARDLMRACGATLRPEDSIERAARVMRETRDGSIPVVDGAGRLIGIVSYRDITVKLVAMGASIPHAQVSDCMTPEAFACSAESTLESCLSAMSWHQVKRLPIVDDDHRIIGIVSRSDLACYVCEHPHGLEPGAITDVLWALAS
jgi:CBS domain-containing protein